MHLLVSYLFAMGIVTVIKIGGNCWTIAFSAIILVFVTSLLAWHMYLALNNITSKEDGFCRRQTSRNSKHTVHHNEKPLARCNVTLFWPSYRLDITAVPDFASLPPILVTLDVANKPWKRSMWENWKSVFGVKWWRWFLPLSPKIEKERWWECEFSEQTKSLLREKAQIRLREIEADKRVSKPEKAREGEPL